MSLDAHTRMPGRSFADRILRRGPLEAIATTIIAAGVVMLMQPFFADAVFLVVRDHAVRHSDVHHCLEGQGVGRMAQIRVEALDKSFGNFHAVKAASFTVEDGEFLCLLGPSGCGKTTTLRMIAGLELPTAGTIRLDGEDVTMNRASARDIAFVFQLFALYPHMNVRRNIGFPLKCEGIGAAEADRRVVEAARILRISHLLDRPVSGLAGGDRQRVALGRAIVRKPKCFLMDEPLGALDTEMREAMIRELRALHDRLRSDHGLCHARSARGHGDGRYDRRDEQRCRRAGREPARHL